MKTCCRCGKTKPFVEFYKWKTINAPVGPCRSCRKEDRKLVKQIKSDYDKKHYRNNREKTLVQASEYYQNHKEEKRIYDLSVRTNQYAKRRQRYKTDMGYRIKCLLRSRLGAVLRACKTKKCANTTMLIGCTTEELTIHIENQFTKGMDWKQVVLGKIYIDHIKPCASFDLTDPEQQKQCFHYTNLQPLWAIDNNFKRAKVDIHPSSFPSQSYAQ